MTRPIRKTQEGCGGLGGENPERSRRQGRFSSSQSSLPESAQTFSGIAFRAAGKSGNRFQRKTKGQQLKGKIVS